MPTAIRWLTSKELLSVTSFRQSLQEALDASVQQGITVEETITTIIGNFQRIDLYTQKGCQLPQDIPAACWMAYHQLVNMGYTTQFAT